MYTTKFTKKKKKKRGGNVIHGIRGFFLFPLFLRCSFMNSRAKREKLINLLILLNSTFIIPSLRYFFVSLLFFHKLPAVDTNLENSLICE